MGCSQKKQTVHLVMRYSTVSKLLATPRFPEFRVLSPHHAVVSVNVRLQDLAPTFSSLSSDKTQLWKVSGTCGVHKTTYRGP